MGMNKLRTWKHHRAMVTTATTMVDMVAMVTGMGVIIMDIMTMAMGTGMVMDTEDTIIMVTAMVTVMDMEDTMDIIELTRA